MPKRGRSRSLARKGTSAAAAKGRHCQEDAQQSNSFALPSALFGQQPASTIVVPSRFCHGSIVVRAPSKKRRSSEARRRRASLLVYIYMYISVKMAALWGTLTLLSFHSLCLHLRSHLTKW